MVAVDAYTGFIQTLHAYRSAGVIYAVARGSWDRLWQEIAQAYRQGKLSDNEMDDLLNRFSAEVW